MIKCYSLLYCITRLCLLKHYLLINITFVHFFSSVFFFFHFLEISALVSSALVYTNEIPIDSNNNNKITRLTTGNKKNTSQNNQLHTNTQQQAIDDYIPRYSYKIDSFFSFSFFVWKMIFNYVHLHKGVKHVRFKYLTWKKTTTIVWHLLNQNLKKKSLNMC